MIKSQRFYRYLLSYILITVISLLIMSGVVYKQFLSTMRTEVEHSMIKSLDQFREAINQRILEMDRMALQISRNSQLKPFKVTTDGYGTFEAIEEMKQYLSTNMFIEDIFIHYNGRSTDTLYAASGTYDLDLFFEDIYRFENWNQEEFLKMSTSISGAIMRPVDQVLFGHITNERFATYSVPLLANSETPYGIVMFLISEQAFHNLAINVLGDYNGTLYVLGKQDEILYEYSKGIPDNELMAEMIHTLPGGNKTWNIASLDHKKNQYTVVKRESDNRGYRFVAAMPSDQIMHKVNKAKDMYNLTAMAIFLFGVILAVTLSVRNYKPLQKLIRVITSQNPCANARDQLHAKDELAFISFAVANMIRENEGLIHQLHSQALALREQFLLSLIKGKFNSPEEYQGYLHSANLQMDCPYFVVLLFFIDDYGRFRTDNSTSMQDYLKSSLIKIVEEAFSEAGHGIGVELIDGRSIVVLLNLKEGHHSNEALQHYAEQARQTIDQYFRFTVTIGVGRIIGSVTEISQSFIEASHAARYRLVKGGNKIIFYRDIAEDGAKERWYPVEMIDRLVRAIRQGDSQAVEQAVQNAFKHITVRRMPVGAVLFICYDIVNNIAKTLIELDIELDEATNEALEKLFVPHIETVEEIERLVIDICCSICRTTSDKKESKNIELLNQITAYIHEHYTDHSISLESIADQFGISPSYATRFFKNQTGNSLMRYIDCMRMHQAKQLLKTTNLTLKDILVKVGYIDQTNFIRKFKKNEGVTPIQYRNLMNSEV